MNPQLLTLAEGQGRPGRLRRSTIPDHQVPPWTAFIPAPAPQVVPPPAPPHPSAGGGILPLKALNSLGPGLPRRGSRRCTHSMKTTAGAPNPRSPDWNPRSQPGSPFSPSQGLPGTGPKPASALAWQTRPLGAASSQEQAGPGGGDQDTRGAQLAGGAGHPELCLQAAHSPRGSGG